MQYRVKLAQADVINMNNRCYSKECLEQIKNQINEKTVAVADERGEKEMTLAISEANGVISSKPGLLINNNKEDNMQPIALIGKVPVRAVGIVHKFDRITLSDIPGVAKVAKDGDKVIGVALEN